MLLVFPHRCCVLFHSSLAMIRLVLRSSSIHYSKISFAKINPTNSIGFYYYTNGMEIDMRNFKWKSNYFCCDLSCLVHFHGACSLECMYLIIMSLHPHKWDDYIEWKNMAKNMKMLLVWLYFTNHLNSSRESTASPSISVWMGRYIHMEFICQPTY